MRDAKDDVVPKELAVPSVETDLHLAAVPRHARFHLLEEWRDDLLLDKRAPRGGGFAKGGEARHALRPVALLEQREHLVP